MVGVSKEVVDLIYYLLPGFLTAWVFYSLTAHPKRSPFERTVQALIFTALVRAFVVTIRGTVLIVGTSTGWVVGTWSEDIEFVCAIIIAFLFGHVLSFFANNNLYHRMVAGWRITSKTSYPSEWFSTFSQLKCHVVLHLIGKRRLYGWPYEWPDHPESGQFVIQEPVWLLEDNTRAPIIVDEVILIPAQSVEMVEFIKHERLLEGQSDQIEKSEKILINLRQKEASSREQSD